MKRIILLVILLSFALFSAGCKGEQKSCEDILYEICHSLELPAGEKYLLSAEEGAVGYLPDEEKVTLYGNGAVEKLALLEDYAIYLCSFAKPYEVAVFRCRSSSDADTLSELCLERADILNVVLRETEYYDFSQKARVFSKGDIVIMVICDTPEEGLDAARDALK